MIATTSKRKLIVDNAEETFRLLRKKLFLSLPKGIKEKIKNHPSHPSFASFAYGLQQLGIDTIAIKATYEHLKHDLPAPFIVHLSSHKGIFLLVDKVDEEYVYFINEKSRLEKEHKKDFMQQWSGNVLVLDTEQVKRKNNPNFESNDVLPKLRTIFIIFSIGIGIFYFERKFSFSRDVFNYTSLFFTGIGIFISSLLWIRYFDKNNTLLNEICNSPNGKKDCGAVLDSEAATLFGVISWSEIGFLFFTSLFAFLLLMPGTVTNTLVLISSILGLPFIIYSLYYQYKIVKKWCLLCLWIQAVLGILWISGIVLWDITNPENYKLIMTIPHLLIILGIGSAFLFFKPFFAKAYDTRKEDLQYQFNKLKFDDNIFQLLQSREPVIEKPSFLTINFGNPEATQSVLVVFNPKCGPCIEEQKKLFELMKHKKDTFVKQLFLIHPEDRESWNIAINMLYSYENLGQKEFLKTYQSYFENYPKSIHHWETVSIEEEYVLKKYNDVLIDHNTWCDLHQINSTPRSYYNNQQLSNPYSMEDLDYLCF